LDILGFQTLKKYEQAHLLQHQFLAGFLQILQE